MKRAQILLAILAFCGVVLPASSQQPEKTQSKRVLSFDVSDLPARIDEPSLQMKDGVAILNCALANRSTERLLGVRLIVLIVEASGKLRSRIALTEAVESEGASINVLSFQSTVLKDVRETDQLFLAIDEVIGSETIWRTVDAERALRSYSRGRHDVVPLVRTVANKFDPRTKALIFWK